MIKRSYQLLSAKRDLIPQDDEKKLCSRPSLRLSFVQYSVGFGEVSSRILDVSLVGRMRRWWKLLSSIIESNRQSHFGPMCRAERLAYIAR